MVAIRLQGLNITGAIVPFTDKDTFATHISTYGKGGWHEAATIAERNAIPMDRRTKGMAVFVQEDKKLYVLNSSLGNNGWETYGSYDVVDIIRKAIEEGQIIIDMKDYYKKGEIDDMLEPLATKTLLASEIAGLDAAIREWVEGKQFATQVQLADAVIELDNKIAEAKAEAEEAMEAVKAKVDKTVYEAKVSELQGGINLLSNQAKYLGIWDCTAGLSTTNLPKDPYTYEEGSIFVVGKVAGQNEKIHTISDKFHGVEKTLKFVVTDRDEKFTELSDVVQYLQEHGYTSRENALPCTGVLKGEFEENYVPVIMFTDYDTLLFDAVDEEGSFMYDMSLGEITESTVVASVNYKPSGTSYSKTTPSTTQETGTINTNDTYYFDGSDWKLIHTPASSGGGGSYEFERDPENEDVIAVLKDGVRVASIPAPKEIVRGNLCFVAKELVTYYEAFSGELEPETVDGKKFGEDISGGKISYFTEDKGPFLVLQNFDVINKKIQGGNVILLRDIIRDTVDVDGINERIAAKADQTDLDATNTALIELRKDITDNYVTNAKLEITKQKVEANTAKITEVEGKVDTNTTKIAQVEAKADANAEAIETLDGKAVKYQDYQGRKTIQLSNYDNISGVDTQGVGHNLAMVSKWDVADFGAAGLHMNLNTKDIVTVNDSEVVTTNENLGNFIVEGDNVHIDPEVVTDPTTGLEYKRYKISAEDAEGTLEQAKAYTDSKVTQYHSYEELEKMESYLYSIKFNSLQVDYDYGYAEMENRYHQSNDNGPVESSPRIGLGGCSSVRNGDFYGRNYDWVYSNTASFIVKVEAGNGRHASVGIATNDITEAEADSQQYLDKYKFLPFRTLDGINDAGVVANLNVVPTGDKGRTISTHPGNTPICMLMLVRYVLDHFETAQDAVDWLANEANVYAPATSTFDQECHLMVGDKDNTFVVEFVDNAVNVIDVSERPWMTNFYITDASFNEDNTVKYETVTPHGNGLERFDIIANSYDTANTMGGMRNLMDSLKYTQAYTKEVIEGEFWKTEFAGGPLTVTDPIEKYAETIAIAKEFYANRSRDEESPYYGTCQTISSCVYDIPNRKFSIVVQERAKINQKVVTLKGEEGTILEIQTDVINLKTDVIEVQGNISTLQNNKVEVVEYEEDITDLNEKLEEIRDRIPNDEE